MQHTNHLLRVFFSAVTALLAFGASAIERPLVANGASDYAIVLQPTASPSEQTAANELQQRIKDCVGVTLPIVSEPPTSGAPMIVLGMGPIAESLGVAPDPEALGEQGYTLQTSGQHIIIAGTPVIGTLYGVFDFLEEFLGVRWYAPGVTRTPAVKNVSIPHLDRTVTPAFLWRHTGFPWQEGETPFRPYVRDNSGKGDVEHPWGVQHAFDGQCHSYFTYIDPDRDFDAHPEYFSEIGGKRHKEETQLCLTNPEVLDLVTERMLKRMESMPGVRQHNFSQMDWYNYCQCANCTAMNERYGTTGGTQFWFVNQLAERTAKVFPEKAIGTLAYTYTEEPPVGLEMHPNVAVWLCHMFPSCDSHPIETCPLDAEYKRRAIAWSGLTDHLYIWHYTVDYAHYFAPFPNFRALAADLKFYEDIGVEGMYLQSGTWGGDFNLLRPWYYMKLAWNPYQDADALLQDFLEGYYGDASGPLYKYITMIHDKVERENIHMHLYTNPGQGFLPDELLRTADGLFDRAEAAVAENAELLERVKVARMAVDYARFFPRNGYTMANGQLRVLGDAAPPAKVDEFLARMKTHGYSTIREWGGDPAQLHGWSLFMNNPVPYERIESPYLMVDVVPFFGGRAVRIIDRATAECVTSFNKVPHLYFPFCGGEGARFGTSFNTPVSNMAMYQVAGRTADSITLETKVLNFAIRRTLTLLPDRPVLRVTNTFVNTADKPDTLISRNHLQLDLGDLPQTQVAFTDRAGKAVTRDMAPIIAGLREGEAYRNETTPNGQWSFTGSKGLRVTQTFDPEQVDFTWATAFPADLNELELEVWSKPVVLEPGQSATYTNEIEISPAQ